MTKIYVYPIIYLFFHGILLFKDLILKYNPQLELFSLFVQPLLLAILYFVLIAKLYNGLFSFGGLLVGIASVISFFNHLVEITLNYWIFIFIDIIFFIGLISTPIYIITHPTDSELSINFKMTGWGLFLLSGSMQTVILSLSISFGFLIQNTTLGYSFGLIISGSLSILGVFLFTNGLINSSKSEVKSNE